MVDENKDDIPELESKNNIAPREIGIDGWKSIRKIRWAEGDPNFYQKIKSYLKDGVLPQMSRSAKSRFMRWVNNFFDLDDDDVVLVTSTPRPESSFNGQAIFQQQPQRYTVVPPEAKKDIILALFRSEETGFLGAETLFHTIRQSYLGITRHDVMEVLRNVEIVQLNRATRDRITQPITTTYPNQIWFADLMDMSRFHPKLNNGYHFILNIIDHFTRFLIASVAIKSKHAEVVAAEIEAAIQNYNPPSILSTDRGTEFNNAYLYDLAERYGFQLRISPPYSSNNQGSVEILNRGVRRYLEQYMRMKDTKRWIDRIGIYRFNHNNKIHSTTGITPFSAMFRRLQVHNCDRLIIRQARKLAHKMIKMAQKKRGKRKALPDLKVGDTVRMDTTSVGKKAIGFVLRAQRRQGLKFRWSRELYTVSEKFAATEEGKADYFTLDYEPQPDKRFHRDELMKIDREALILPDRDKNFINTRLFDREAHLRRLASSRLSTEVIDESQQEVEDEGKLMDLAGEEPRPDQPRRSSRIRNQPIIAPPVEPSLPVARRVKREIEGKESPNLAQLVGLSEANLRKLKRIKRIKNFPGSIFNQPGLVYSSDVVKIVKKGRQLGKVQVRMDDDSKLWYFSAGQILKFARMTENQASRYRKAE